MTEGPSPTPDPRVAAIVIGRNEGDRLVRCLTSLQGQVAQMVYVDSGSTDDSVAAATGLGATVVELDTSIPFTAARARNAGANALKAGADPSPDFLQFVDGDCEVDPGWISTALDFLQQHETVAVVCGRRREKAPDASLYNKLCDMEWDTPVGEAKACGGDALMRADAFYQVGGYRDDVIAGEEPELCVRLRAAGYKVHRLDAEMTLHDAAMTRFSQFWKRAKRAGYAFMLGALMHGRTAERHWVKETLRMFFWAGLLPLILILSLFVGRLGLLFLVIYPVQALRIAHAVGGGPDARAYGVFTMISHFAGVSGALKCLMDRARRRRAEIIEYK